MSDKAVICSAHFNPDNFIHYPSGMIRLSNDAVPVIFNGVKRRGWLARGVCLEPVGLRTKRRKRKLLKNVQNALPESHAVLQR